MTDKTRESCPVHHWTDCGRECDDLRAASSASPLSRPDREGYGLWYGDTPTKEA